MNQPLEFTGKNVNSAVEAACKQLDIPQKELKYNVISTGTTGIFGIVGRKDARIRVTLPAKKHNNPRKTRMAFSPSLMRPLARANPRQHPNRPLLHPKSRHRNQCR